MSSFLDVYPHASLWTIGLHGMLLVGSLAPFDLEVARIVERFNRPGVGAALRDVGISSPEGLMATWITARAGLETYAGNARKWAYDRTSPIGKLDRGLDEAAAKGWTVVDMRNDWKSVFAAEELR